MATLASLSVKPATKTQYISQHTPTPASSLPFLYTFWLLPIKKSISTIFNNSLYITTLVEYFNLLRRLPEPTTAYYLSLLLSQ